MNFAGVGSNEAETTTSESDGTVVAAEMCWDLVVSWRKLTVDEEVSRLGDIIAWIEVRREVRWDCLRCRCTDQRTKVVWVWVVVVMNFVHGILLYHSTVVGNVSCFEVTRWRIVDITVAICENRWHCGWRRCDSCRNSVIVKSVDLVEDLVVRDVVPSEDVSPLVRGRRAEDLSGLEAVV